MAFALLILSALSAEGAPSPAAGGYPVSDPSFWQRRYQIPQHYEFAALALRVKSRKSAEEALPALMQSFGARQTEPDEWQVHHGTGPGLVPSYWLVPSDRAESALRRLRQLGTLYNFYRGEYRTTWGSMAGPDPAEVYFKRDGLRTEWRALAAQRDSLRAVGGLLDSQMAALDALAQANDDALAYMSVSLLLAGPKDDGAPPAAHPTWGVRIVEARDHSSLYGSEIPSSSGLPAGYWRRSGGAFVCGAQDDPLQVTLESDAPPQAVERLDGCLKTVKSSRLLDGCVPASYLPGDSEASTQHWTRASWVDPGRLDELRRCLGRLGTIKEWDRAGLAVWRGIDPAVQEKHRLLKGELSALRPDKAPVLHGLVSAEVSRLKPMASAYQATASKELVNVVVLSATER